MNLFKGFGNTTSKRTLSTGLLLFLTINQHYHYVRGETGDGNENGSAYTCCPLQETFKDFSCDAVQPSSEFDMNFHQARWNVPRMFRDQEEAGFQLVLEQRNPSKFCKGSFRIHKSISQTGPPKLPPSPSLNENETTGGTAPPESPTPIFFANGSMTYGNRLYNSREYCFDSLWEKGEQSEFDIVVFDDQQRDGCVKQVLEISTPAYYRHQRESWIKEVFAAVAGLSCLFSVVDVIIYLSLRKYLNVSGWTEFTYFLALVAYSALSIPALLWPEPKSTSEIYLPSACYTLSVLLQFFQIVTYSSYLMIAFDVYWMLRKSTNMGSYGDDTEVESKMRLIIYYFLLFSIPLGVLTYGLVLNQGYIEAMYDGDGLIPHYGLKSCFSPQWLISEYLNYALESVTFLIILLSVNLIFGRLSRSADVEDAPRVSLLSNMFFFTLTYWIVDLLQFTRPLFMNYSYDQATGQKNGTETFWIVLEGFGYAQGILAFIVFVFNRKTLRAFRKKSGSDGTLREIFRHACCGSGSGVRRREQEEEDLTPMSPLMKTTSMRRTTVRRSQHY